jgi:hypothetical protein
MALAPAVIPYLPELIAHIGAGSIAILSGYAAVTVAKGERAHRAFGTVFAAAMLITGAMATYMAASLQHVMIGQKGNITGGIFAAYLAATGWMTVRRKEASTGQFEKIAAVVIASVAATDLIWGMQASLSPFGKLDGYAAPFYYVFAAIAALFGAMDFKVILQGGISGAARIARHLWRMCFALFFAAGSFFIGQQKVMPAWLHGSPILLALGLAPLGFLVFWLLRVRFANWYKSADQAI